MKKSAKRSRFKLKIDRGKVKEIKRRYRKEMEFSPAVSPLTPFPKTIDAPIRRRERTMHEGEILYLRYWNYWVRAGERALEGDQRFYPDFENPNPRIFSMIADMGVTTTPSAGERHIWEKIAAVWRWLRAKVDSDSTAYAAILDSSVHPNWPSIDDYAAYYEDHGRLVWSACFSKAHVFVSILGRVGIPRWRLAIAESHHTENGAPPTATHVFVAVYVAKRWFYLDPTWVYAVPELPGFRHRASVGLFAHVDYRHPYATIPIPLSGFDRVPLLPD